MALTAANIQTIMGVVTGVESTQTTLYANLLYWIQHALDEPGKVEARTKDFRRFQTQPCCCFQRNSYKSSKNVLPNNTICMFYGSLFCN